MAITEAKSSMPASQPDGQDAGFNHTDIIQQLSFLSLVLPASLLGWTSQQPYTLAFEDFLFLEHVLKAFLPIQDHLSHLGVIVQVPTVIVPSPPPFGPCFAYRWGQGSSQSFAPRNWSKQIQKRDNRLFSPPQPHLPYVQGSEGSFFSSWHQLRS